MMNTPFDVEYLAALHEEKERRKTLAKAYQNLKGCDIASARRWVRRQDNNGLSLDEISTKIAEIWNDQVLSKFKETKCL